MGDADTPGSGRADAGWVEGALADLLRLAADQRAARAAAARTARGFLRRLVAEELCLPDLVRDLAAHGEPLVVTTSSGRTHRGRVLALGADFVLVGAPGAEAGRPVLFVPFATVTLLRTGPSAGRRDPAASPGATGSPKRLLDLDATFDDVLSLLAAERALVGVATTHGEFLRGELCAASADVLALREEGELSVTAYVRRAFVSELSLFGSG